MINSGEGRAVVGQGSVLKQQESKRQFASFRPRGVAFLVKTDTSKMKPIVTLSSGQSPAAVAASPVVAISPPVVVTAPPVVVTAPPVVATAPPTLDSEWCI